MVKVWWSWPYLMHRAHKTCVSLTHEPHIYVWLFLAILGWAHSFEWLAILWVVSLSMSRRDGALSNWEHDFELNDPWALAQKYGVAEHKLLGAPGSSPPILYWLNSSINIAFGCTWEKGREIVKKWKGKYFSVCLDVGRKRKETNKKILLSLVWFSKRIERKINVLPLFL